MEIPNLWSDFIFKQEENEPLKILKKQAEYLTEATKGILIGKVEYDGSSKIVLKQTFNIQEPYFVGKAEYDDSNKIVLKHNFNIQQPCLGGFSYNLFIFLQNIDELYPCEIQNKGNTFTIDSEKQLKSVLIDIFSSPNTQKVIQTLISQSDVTH